MIKKDIDWKSLGFNYIQTDYRYVSKYKNGKWDNGKLVKKANVSISESASVFQYAQTCFEGLKAFTAPDGSVVTFRPDLNAERLQESCKRLLMPEIPTEKFLDAVYKVVQANAAWVPPYGSGATLYIRPVVLGISPVIAVNPSTEYEFRILVSPVGPYFKGGFKPLRLGVSDFDRAAPEGTGHIKAGLNYAMSMYAGKIAKEKGFDECLFLDPKTHSYIEESKGANIIFVTKDNKIITPKSASILPSITRRSLLTIAKDCLGIECIERKININEISDFVECGLCGTAAVISPVASITHKNKETRFAGMGSILQKLYDTFIAIQTQRTKGPDGWVKTIIEKEDNKK